MKASPRYARDLRSTLLRWYRQNGRDLPWRDTRDPYAILVSEVMLQQTQVTTVIPYYNEWLRRFPTVETLAHSSENDVLHAWQGLGYYARARNLHAAAKAIVDRHRGRFPREIDQIRELPGVGKYTANAVASFAFDQSVSIVEANTSRVLARLFNIRLPIDQARGRTALWDRAALLIPKASSRIFNSALIDLGALICLPRPNCSVCPVKGFCRASNPSLLPRKKGRPPVKKLIENHAFAVRRNKILLEQSQTRWRGMWILPPLGESESPLSTTTGRANHSSQVVRLDGFKPSSLTSRSIHTSVFPFTHHQITLRVFRHSPRKINPKRQRWFPRQALNALPIPSPHRRAINNLSQRATERPPFKPSELSVERSLR